MDIEYVVTITQSNVPVFHKGWNKGVIQKMIVTFKGAKKKDLKDNPFLVRNILETRDKILADNVKCTYRIVKSNYKIK